MRRLVVALIVIVAAFALVGCGGGEEEAAAPAETASAPAAAVAAPAEEEEVISDTLSPLEEQVFEPFPTDFEFTPPEISSRLDSGVPMIVFLNDGKQDVTLEQTTIIDGVIDEDYRGIVDLVSFDVGEYLTTETSGTITIDSAFDDDEVARWAIALVQRLEVGFTPYIVVVDEYGYITWRNSGLVDAKTLSSQLIRATSPH